MATVELIQDEAGQIFARLPGGALRPVTENQAAQIHANPGALSNVLGAAAEGVGMLAAGAGQLAGIPGAREMRQELGQNLAAREMVAPITTLGGQMAPMVAAGVATAGASIPAQMAGWGAVGAAMDPDDPLTGALLGAGMAAVPGAAGALIRSEGAASIVAKAQAVRNRFPILGQTPEAQVSALQAADQALAGAPAATVARTAAAAPEAPGAPLAAVAAAEPAPAAPAGPMGLVERPELIGPQPRPATPLGILGGADPAPAPAAAAPPGGMPPAAGSAAIPPAAGGRARVLEGFMQPDELAGLGMKLTPGDARALLATTDDELAAARAMRDAEEKARAGLTGGPIERIRNEQAQGFDNFVKRELGIPASDVAALTDTRLGRFFRGINQRFEAALGTIDNAAPAAIERFRGTVDNVTANATSESARIVEEFGQAFAHETRAGQLNAQSMQTLDRFLKQGIKAARRQQLPDKVSDLTTLRSGLMGVLEDSAPAGMRQELQNLNRQYALGATLLRKGARDTSGRMNPQTVRNAWNLNMGYPKSNIGATRISRMLETAAFLNQRLTPTSGTAERLLAAARSPLGTLAGISP